MDYARLSVVVSAGLAVVAYLFGGAPGALTIAAASALGPLPPRTDAKRVSMMAC